ncbi:MAG: hypothetical protein EPO20_15075 [Betaproteobacteria bacterium]|nr:MAG: hypothetical protein EPO20_15075 [Betaproteobacteria bacterium]
MFPLYCLRPLLLLNHPADLDRLRGREILALGVLVALGREEVGDINRRGLDVGPAEELGRFDAALAGATVARPDGPSPAPRIGALVGLRFIDALPPHNGGECLSFVRNVTERPDGAPRSRARHRQRIDAREVRQKNDLPSDGSTGEALAAGSVL